MKTETIAVDEFMSSTQHILKRELIELRKLIKEADSSLSEQIKWNAPSFCCNGIDKITFNLSKKDCLLIIFHRGAKAKPLKLTKPLISVHADLLEWPAFDRGVMKFQSMSEVHAHRSALKTIVRSWIDVTSKEAI